MHDRVSTISISLLHFWVWTLLNWFVDHSADLLLTWLKHLLQPSISPREKHHTTMSSVKQHNKCYLFTMKSNTKCHRITLLSYTNRVHNLSNFTSCSSSEKLDLASDNNLVILAFSFISSLMSSVKNKKIIRGLYT